MSTDLATAPTASPQTSQLWANVMSAALKLRPDFADLMAQALVDALKAESWFYDKAQKGIVHRPDTRSRLDAIKLVMAYAEGLPLQRIFEHKISERRDSLADALRDSPETLEAVKREVEKAEFRTRKRKVEPVEIELP
jgi:hypothetical protein